MQQTKTVLISSSLTLILSCKIPVTCINGVYAIIIPTIKHVQKTFFKQCFLLSKRFKFEKEKYQYKQLSIHFDWYLFV